MGGAFEPQRLLGFVDITLAAAGFVVHGRVLGTRGVSEPILGELLGAWRSARTGSRTAAVDAKICDPTVLAGSAPRGLGDLVVDVRARDTDEHFVVEVQHRAERLFPHRAVLYAAAEIVAQHITKAGAKGPAKRASKMAANAADAAPPTRSEPRRLPRPMRPPRRQQPAWKPPPQLLPVPRQLLSSPP